MALAGFAPTGGTVSLSVGTTSSNVALSLTGSPPTILVTNIGQGIAFVALGTTSAVTASVNGGVAIMPGASVPLTVGSATYLAGIALNAATALNITSGT